MAAVPLHREQVDAAQTAFDNCPELVLSDRSLDDLARVMPGFDEFSCAVKAAAVNSIYYAQVSNVVAAARHCCRTLAGGIPAPPPTELVERLAMVPRDGQPGRTWTLHVFASKFAHFFVSRSLPIMDKHACDGVARHLGLPARDCPLWPYPDYAARFGQLAASVGLGGEPRKLDKYLFIAGQLQARRGDPKARCWWELTLLPRDLQDRIIGPE